MMKVIKETSEKIQIEFLKEEYFAIKNWLVGKEPGEVNLKVRDSLENFISMESFLNPNQELNHQPLTKEEFLNKVDHYYYIAKNYPERYFKGEESDFKNLFSSDEQYKEVWRIFGRTFAGMYPFSIADDFIELLNNKNIEDATNEIIGKIHLLNTSQTK